MATIDEERRAFEKLLPDLLAEHKGEWVVVHGGQPKGFFTTFDEAFDHAVRTLGDESTYLVTRVAEQEPEAISLTWTAGVMFG